MPEWMALRDDVEERGILEPLQIFGDLVVDGETRRGVAASLGMDSVPCVEITEDEVLLTIRQHLILQKHLTKGQRAYLLTPHAKGLCSESSARKLANLKKGHSPKPTESASGNIGLFEDFCRDNGFSKDLGEQAKTLHAIFSGDPSALKARNLQGCDPEELRATWEPRILDLEAPIGLGAALAGIAGERATKDQPKVPNGAVQLDLFVQAASGIDRVAKSWGRMRHDDRPKFVQAWKRVATGWPVEMRRELGMALLEGTETPQ